MTILLNQLGGFGINFSGPSDFFHYTIGFEFTVLPPGIESESVVAFDLTRQIETKYWKKNSGSPWQQTNLPWEEIDSADESNDDPDTNGALDQDVTPMNSHIYVLDGPGLRNNGLIDEFVAKLNFYEFVRVSFDGIGPRGENSEGSRSSQKTPWHAHYWVEGDGTQYAPKAHKFNSVGEGHQPLGGDIIP